MKVVDYTADIVVELTNAEYAKFLEIIWEDPHVCFKEGHQAYVLYQGKLIKFVIVEKEAK